MISLSPATSDSDSSDISDYDNNNSDNNSDSDSDNNITAMIPIIISPCENFEFPKVKNIYIEENKLTKYFKDHHISCKKCDTTNNNDINLREILIYHKNYEIQYQESTERDTEINDELEYYYNLKPYNPFIDPDKTTIKIKHIMNFESDYDNCLFIQWIIKN